MSTLEEDAASCGWTPECVALRRKFLKEVDMMKGGHVQMKCADPDCGGSCNACCLAWCSVCHGAEGSLPTRCPGRFMSTLEQEGVQAGRLDYVNGGWCSK